MRGKREYGAQVSRAVDKQRKFIGGAAAGVESTLGGDRLIGSHRFSFFEKTIKKYNNTTIMSMDIDLNLLYDIAEDLSSTFEKYENQFLTKTKNTYNRRIV